MLHYNTEFHRFDDKNVADYQWANTLDGQDGGRFDQTRSDVFVESYKCILPPMTIPSVQRADSSPASSTMPLFKSKPVIPESPDFLQEPVTWEQPANWLVSPAPRRQFRTPSPKQDYTYGVPYHPNSDDHVPLPLPSAPYSYNHYGSPLADKSRVITSHRSLGNIHRPTPERYRSLYPQPVASPPPVPDIPVFTLPPHPEEQRRINLDYERRLDEEQHRLSKEIRAQLKEELKKHEAQERAEIKKAKAFSKEAEKYRKREKRQGMASSSSDMSSSYRTAASHQPQFEASTSYAHYSQPPPRPPPNYPPLRHVQMPQYSAYPPNETTPPPGVLASRKSGLRKSQSTYQYHTPTHPYQDGPASYDRAM